MAQEFEGLVALHKIARAYGDGLKPELVALMDQRAPEGSIAFNAPQRSAGHAHHRLDPAELAARGVACLTLAQGAKRRKDGTDG